MTTLKITDIGDAGSVVLPPEIIAKLGAQQGDEVRVVATAAGVEFQKQAASPEKQMDLARQIMTEDDQVLRKLAE